MEKRGGGVLGQDSFKGALSPLFHFPFSLPVERTGEGAGLGAAGPPWAVWEARQVGVTVIWSLLSFSSISGKLQGDFSKLPRQLQEGSWQS